MWVASPSSCLRAVLGLGLAACAGPSEAPRVEHEVRADASGLGPVTTDLGYRVTLSAARLALGDLAFTVAGELHEASVLENVGELLIARAHAHPGHYEGGDVTGELRGRFVIDWLAEPTLGTATLLAGDYEGVNFLFERARQEDGLDADDPLLGHTALLRGQAERNGRAITFEARVDSPDGRVLVGVPFEVSVEPDSSGVLRFRLDLEDPFEGDTLFDGIDFEALDGDDDGQVTLDASSDGQSEDAYNLLRRTLQTHDHYAVTEAQ